MPQCPNWSQLDCHPFGYLEHQWVASAFKGVETSKKKTWGLFKKGFLKKSGFLKQKTGVTIFSARAGNKTLNDIPEESL